jgi:undecaprenyl-diphosphatase
LDETLFHLINQRWTNPLLDLLMAALANVEIWRPLLIGVVIFMLVFDGFRGRACVLCLLLLLSISEQVTSVLKTAIDRHRPKQVQTVRLVELQHTRPAFMTLFHKTTIRYSDASDRTRSGPSFPSGHVTDNTVIALCLTLFYRRGWLYWIIAATIGYGRIYLGAHWPSDVLATFFLAAGETLLILAGLEWLWQRLAPKWMPQISSRHPSLVESAYDRHYDSAASPHSSP